MLRTIKKHALILMFAVPLIVLSSCNPTKEWEQQERAEIDSYLAENANIPFELKPSGLYYAEITTGTGDFPVLSDTAFVKYTGKFLDGTIFDTNVGKNDTLSFPVLEGWLIDGFDEGIKYMKPGGKALLLIPSHLAYGTAGYGFISGFTPLLFDVELCRVSRGPN